MLNAIVQQNPNGLSDKVITWNQFKDAADEAARSKVFVNYRKEKAARTLQAHDNDLRKFLEYLNSLPLGALPEVEDLATIPECWQGITFGIVSNYRDWLETEGYAVKTINRYLSTVKIYCKLAHRAEIIPFDAHAMIRGVVGVSNQRAFDQNRKKAGLDTRKSSKKAEPTELRPNQVKLLKTIHDMNTAQGRRDKLLMVLLLDHGLRCGDLAKLKVKNIVLGDTHRESFISFTAEKNHEVVKHHLFLDSFEAMKKYQYLIPEDPEAYLLRSSRRDGTLTEFGMSNSAIYARVRTIGKKCGIEKLSPHDCRHSGAKRITKASGNIMVTKAWGGWKSLDMPSHYGKIVGAANEGIDQI